jgi:hypothetical protein
VTDDNSLINEWFFRLQNRGLLSWGRVYCIDFFPREYLYILDFGLFLFSVRLEGCDGSFELSISDSRDSLV